MRLDTAAPIAVGLLAARLALAQPTSLDPTPPIREPDDAPAPFFTLAAVVPIYLLTPAVSAGDRLTRFGGGVSAEFALPQPRRSYHLGVGLMVSDPGHRDPLGSMHPSNDFYFVGLGARYWPTADESSDWKGLFVGASLRLNVYRPGGLEGGSATEAGATLDACAGLVTVSDGLLNLELALHLGYSSPTQSFGSGIYVAPSLGFSLSPR